MKTREFFVLLAILTAVLFCLQNCACGTPPCAKTECACEKADVKEKIADVEKTEKAPEKIVEAEGVADSGPTEKTAKEKLKEALPEVPREKSGLYESCKWHTDCKEGLACQEKLCFRSCKQQNDCAHYQYCTYNVCIDCLNNAECPSGFICGSMHCVKLPSCVTDKNCPEGYTCYYSACLRNCGELGGDCSHGQVCLPSLNGSSRFCTIKLSKCYDAYDKNCGDGEYCNATHGYCQEFPTCAKDADCPYQGRKYYCVAKVCRPGCSEYGACNNMEYCYTTPSFAICRPFCTAIEDCLVSGYQCNSKTSRCEPI